MFKTKTHVTRLVGAAAAAAALAFGASGAVSATTEPPEPTEPMHTEAGHEAGTAAAQEVDGSAEASSPEAEAFCAAAVAGEAAANGEDPAAIEAAFAEVVELAPEELADAVGVITSNPPDSPEFAEGYASVIEYMKANCGYAELEVAASEYAFGGLPPEVAAGPTIVTLANIGEEVHEIAIMRINDDVTLTVEELLALPEEEGMSMVTPAGFGFAFPGVTTYALSDLTPGRYVALCFLPEGATPEIISQMEGPESSTPPGATLGPPHFVLGMVHEFQAV